MTWTALAVAAVVLDLDALPRIWGGGDIALLGGHRALTHSLAFALFTGILLAFGIGCRGFPRWRLAAVLAIAVATHAGLDALTSYGVAGSVQRRPLPVIVAAVRRWHRKGYGRVLHGLPAGARDPQTPSPAAPGVARSPVPSTTRGYCS